MKKLHTSWLIAWTCFGILLGIGLSREYPSFVGMAWWILAINMLIIGFRWRKLFSVALVVLAGTVIGLARGSIVQTNLQQYESLIASDVLLSGTVAEDAAFGTSGDQRLKLKDIVIDDGKYLPGQVWLSSNSKSEIKRSDRITVSGKVSEGFGNFPIAIYQADVINIQRVAYADVPRDIRDKFSEAVRKIISEPQASLGLGYLSGQRSSLPEELSENLRILGLTHIIVASGYNLTILVRFSRRLLAPVSKYLSVLSGFTLIGSFVLITGLSPSMSRAGLITSLSLLAWYFGRSIHPVVLLAFGAAATAIFNPSYVWGDLGWYLSFAAFGGVIILSPLLIDYFWGKERPNGLLQVMVETSSAQLATLPIIAYAFGQYAPLGILSNMLILPFIPVAMIATFVAGLGGLIFGSVGLIGLPASLVLNYMTWIVDKLSLLPIATSEVAFSLEALVAFYVGIIVLVIFLYRRTRHDFQEDNIIQ